MKTLLAGRRGPEAPVGIIKVLLFLPVAKKGPDGLALPNNYCDFCLGDSKIDLFLKCHGKIR